MVQFTAAITGYTLPDDGIPAKVDFLSLLHSPGETWIFAYNFSDPALIDEILAADAEGVVVHCLIDRVQSQGPSEKAQIARMRAAMKHGDLTITTAGCDSQSTGQIWHYKCLVTDDTLGAQAHCWEGSVNFSVDGWLQGNSAFHFQSDAWASEIKRIYTEHREWALANHPDWQAG